MLKKINDKFQSFLEILGKDIESEFNNNIEHKDIMKMLEKMSFDIEQIRKAVVG